MTLFKGLLIALLAGNVLLRVFTNQFNLLPRHFNLWDLAVTILLGIVSLGFNQAREPSGIASRVRKRLAYFNLACACGSILNASDVHPLPVLSQLLMWNQPMLLLLAILHVPLTLGDLRAYKRVLLLLMVVQVSVGCAQVPIYWSSGASESITGTFKGNAEQYQFFVCIGLFYLIARHEGSPAHRTVRMLLIVILLVLIILIDNKASWVSLGVAMASLLMRLPVVRSQSGSIVRRYGLFITLSLIGYFAIAAFSGTAAKKYGAVLEAWRSGNLMNVGKVKAARDVLSAYRDHPHMMAVGAGLGTFYSRAAFQFFPVSALDLYQSMPVQGEMMNDSASMAGVISPIRDVEPFYRHFFDKEKIFAIGSGTTDAPGSSYVALFGECGLIGGLCYLGIYAVTLRKVRNILLDTSAQAEFFPLIAAGYSITVYLLCMGFYGFWMETGRVSTIVWTLLGLVIVYQRLQEVEEGQ